MNENERARLVFDWAEVGPHRFARPPHVMVNDETLRDGLQSPSITEPSLATKIRLLHLMEGLGIDAASLGIPGAGSRQMEAVLSLGKEIACSGMNLRPHCGGRTLEIDVRAIVEVAQKSGLPIGASLFIGSSPIRQYVEAWDIEQITQYTRRAIEFAVREGLEVMYITEDSVRSSPEHLAVLLRTAVDAGAHRVCLCDTVGSAIPEGVMNLIDWVRRLVEDLGVSIGIDWHGHCDRGLGLANTLAAIQAGATRVHGTSLGIGERVGNTSIEEILVNLRLLGFGDRDLTTLPTYSETVATATGLPIAASTPIVGCDAFRTATGVHAAAVTKAFQRGDNWLADRVYSGVPASWVGRHQKIEIGPMSGASNVIHFLDTHGLAHEPEVIEAVLVAAKTSERILTEDEVLRIIGDIELSPQGTR